MLLLENLLLGLYPELLELKMLIKINCQGYLSHYLPL